ncbi:MAG: FKBP-type peptidyl-prolyl cis-trans isomerase, partial [Thermoplasmata archaeon]|nr:FKBP-type peptidyl-prolyl cis-trans isomerase [Thermoplasmata archaeon]
LAPFTPAVFSSSAGMPPIRSEAMLVTASLLIGGIPALEENTAGVNGASRGGEEEAPSLGVEIGYLDDTNRGNDTWTCLISSTEDYGVVWINNTGNITDTYVISVTAVPEGWTVSQDKLSVCVEPENEMGWVVLSYIVPEGFKGEGVVNVTVESQTDPTVNASLSIVCTVERTDAEVAEVGDTIMVDYVLTDTDGNELDSGTLPVTAGEPYVGYLQQVAYIDGFYLGVLGIRLPQPARGIDGETKVIRVPPELAYGTDPEAHQLGGETLIFTLTAVQDLPG